MPGKICQGSLLPSFIRSQKQRGQKEGRARAPRTFAEIRISFRIPVLMDFALPGPNGGENVSIARCETI